MEMTISSYDMLKRVTTADELGYIRDLIGFAPERFSINETFWTMYVRADGDDDSTGITENEALVTIRMAIKKAPFDPRKKVVIDVGPGSYQGFGIGNHDYFLVNEIGILKSLEIRGTMLLAEVTTGVSQGTASAGSTDSEDRHVLTKPAAAANWTVDELIGKRLDIISGSGRAIAFIVDNDATTLTTSNRSIGSGYDATSVFEIKDYGTKIDQNYSASTGIVIAATTGKVRLTDLLIAPDSGSFVTGVYILDTDIVEIEGCKILGDGAGRVSIGIGAYYNRGTIYFQNSLIDQVGNAYGRVFFLWTYASFQLGYSAVTNILSAADIMEFRSPVGLCRIYDSYFDGDNTADRGIRIYQGQVDMAHSYIGNFLGDGILALGSAVNLLLRDCKIKNCKNGINFGEEGVGAGSSINCGSSYDKIYIEDCSADGIVVKQTKMSLSKVSGSGNVGYGLRLGVGSTVDIASTVDVTGTTGDGIVGSTAADYAVDLPNPGDYVSEPNRGIVLERV